MKAINKTGLFALTLLYMYLLAGCTKERFVTLEEQIDREYRIAIVLPFSQGLENHWKKSVNWALDNINTSLIKHRNIKIKAEWHDEDSSEMNALFAGLANREDISAIIGPLYSKDAEIAARQCVRTGKPLLAMASSELLMRAFAGKDFLWCLTENDISQCELLLTLAARKGARKVALLACDNIYGQTFLDWFAFQAKEMNMNITGTEIYNDSNLDDKMKILCNSTTDCIICIPSDNRVALRMHALSHSYADNSPFLLFSDVAFLAAPDKTLEGMEGIVQAPDPESGFRTAYEIKYGTLPEYGSAQFYDAVLLAGLGILEADLAGEERINAALKRIVDGEGEAVNVCSDETIDCIVSSLTNRQYPRISGASGKLRFDNSLYTNVLHSVYSHQMVYEGKYLILGYIASDESKRSSSTSVNWNWKVTQSQNFENTVSINYPPKEGLYAVIIAGSAGWVNYRHQADALAIYRILQERKVPDDRILLIMEDDIAFHPANPDPGEIRIVSDGKNLYSPQPIIDYKPSDIDFEVLQELLSGKGEKSIAPDSIDNVLVFWIGHGERSGLKWLDKTVTPEQTAGAFNGIANEKRFRKLLFIIEACYAGKIGEECVGIPGLLCITAATADETSKVNHYSYRLGTWLSNSFTDALIDCLFTVPALDLVDLYTKTYNRTMGSHVSVYNASCFGNLNETNIEEFLIP